MLALDGGVAGCGGGGWICGLAILEIYLERPISNEPTNLFHYILYLGATGTIASGKKSGDAILPIF